jgi:addiction module HigA family antidote
VSQHRQPRRDARAHTIGPRLPLRDDPRFEHFSARSASVTIPVHPGEHLADELTAQGLSGKALARCIDVQEGVIGAILAGHAPVTDDIAGRLARFFGIGIGFWIALQEFYDRDVAIQLVMRGESTPSGCLGR